ncbi:hypothetical protein niasHT_021852 [Heterodera trifolii]|uniref:DUF7808 domain-containing protein n=1 Tax=Heterodera trifolii TaxID=157864 RepID=A0ABD2JTY0_9BILA
MLLPLIISFIPLTAFFLSAIKADTETIHWEWRDLICQTNDKGKGNDKITEEPAQCTVALRETEQDTKRRKAPNGEGCFDEIVNGTTRTYCDLLCPKADTVYLIKRDPQAHRSCFVFFTHRLERRGENWFLWRENKCRHSQITFTARCEFLFGRREMPSDAELFNTLRKRNK